MAVGGGGGGEVKRWVGGGCKLGGVNGVYKAKNIKIEKWNVIFYET